MFLALCGLMVLGGLLMSAAQQLDEPPILNEARISGTDAQGNLKNQLAKLRAELMRVQMRIAELEMDALEPMDIPDRTEPPAFSECVLRIIPPDSQVSDYGVTLNVGIPGSSSIMHVASYTNPQELALYNFHGPTDRRLEIDDFEQGRSNLFLVNYKMGNSGPYVLTYTSLDVTNADYRVAIGEGKTPGVLGLTENTGVLKTSNLVYSVDQGATPPCIYLDHPDYGSPSDLAAGAAVVNSLTFDPDSLCHVIAYGTTNLTQGDIMPDGTNQDDMLQWNSSSGEWDILLNDGDTYQVLQKKADGTVDFDWVRAH